MLGPESEEKDDSRKEAPVFGGNAGAWALGYNPSIPYGSLSTILTSFKSEGVAWQ